MKKELENAPPEPREPAASNYDEVALAKLQMSRRLVVCEAVDRPHSYAICSCTEGHHGARLAPAEDAKSFYWSTWSAHEQFDLDEACEFAEAYSAELRADVTRLEKLTNQLEQIIVNSRRTSPQGVIMNLAELHKEARSAFEEMKAAEMKMDDIDILTESPLFQKAMAAAKKWHAAENEIESIERQARFR